MTRLDIITYLNNWGRNCMIGQHRDCKIHGINHPTSGHHKVHFQVHRQFPPKMSREPMSDPPSPTNTSSQSPTVGDKLFQRPIIGRQTAVPPITPARVRKGGAFQASAAVHKKFRKVWEFRDANGWLWAIFAPHNAPERDRCHIVVGSPQSQDWIIVLSM